MLGSVSSLTVIVWSQVSVVMLPQLSSPVMVNVRVITVLPSQGELVASAWVTVISTSASQLSATSAKVAVPLVSTLVSALQSSSALSVTSPGR